MLAQLAETDEASPLSQKEAILLKPERKGHSILALMSHPEF
jgi:hypothetical protein